MRARIVGIALLVACGASAQYVGGDGIEASGSMGPFSIGSGFARTGNAIIPTFDLNGQIIATSDECTTSKTINLEAPAIPIAFTRASSAWCTKSDGTMVLLSSNQPRRERLGLLIEPSSAGNSLTEPRDLSNAAWTKTTMTCAKDATGPDGVASSASTCTATGAGATVTQTVTVASSRRSTSMRIRRKTGTGAVYVSRDNFGTEVNIGPSLSLTTWKWVREDCGNADNNTSKQWADPFFSTIPNCIPASNLTSTSADPTIGFKLATDADAVEIDMVQDEASSYATSPQTGFTRAADIVDMAASIASLPVEDVEVAVDATTLWSSDGQSGEHRLIENSSSLAGASGLYVNLNQSGGFVSAWIRRTGFAWQFFDRADSTHAGVGRNYRAAFSDGEWAWWFGGRARDYASGATMPNAYPTFGIGGTSTGASNLGGWVSRVRFISIANFAAAVGSERTIILVGDSIVTGAGVTSADALTNPPRAIAELTSSSLANERYVFNDGVSGRTIAGCETAWNTHLTQIANGNSGANTVLLVQCGTNSLAAPGYLSAWATLESMLDAAVLAGVRVLPATITPTGGQSTEDDFNTLLLAWCAAENIECADTYSVMDDPGTPGSLLAAYNSGDGLHPNAAGNAVMAAEWVRAGRVNGYWP